MGVRQEADRRGRLSGPRSSSRSDVAKLLDDLESEEGDAREAAVARLRVIGIRAVTGLVGVIRSTASATARAAALSALDGVDDPRASDVALGVLSASRADERDDVLVAALSVLRDWVTRERGTRVLEALTVVALDKTRSGAVRLAALDALSDLPRALVEPLLDRAPTPADGSSVDDPTAVRAWLAQEEHSAPLSVLHDTLARVRDRERLAATAAEALDWLSVRGAVHRALGDRASRIALYDLRDAFDRATVPLPLDFVTTIARIGDANCLESLARAWAASHGEPWWRARLVESATDLTRRLRLTSRHATLRRVRVKWPGFV